MNSMVSESGTFIRSDVSRDFEARWRSISRKGAIPARPEFSPRVFAPLLRHIVLLDFSTGRSPWSNIRVVGEGVRERVQSDIRSHDYLEFLAPAHHADALRTIELMFDQPCGLWQVMAAHYQRGFSQYLELTAFPFAKDDDPPQLLVHLMPISEYITPMPPGLSVMSMDSAVTFEFIDLGAGVPVWPST